MNGIRPDHLAVQNWRRIQERRTFDGTSKFRQQNMSSMLTKDIGMREKRVANGGLLIEGEEPDPMRKARRPGGAPGLA
jgi:hypothetical protein